MKKLLISISLIVLVGVLFLGFVGCNENEGLGVLDPQVRLKVATTSSLYDTGLWALLEPMFEEEFGIEVDVLYANTGIALQYGQRGDVDLITVHDKARELTFIADGYGTQRYVFAYNYFVIVGPASDPLGLKGLTPEAAFKKLAESKTAEFVSRGDNSGTHSKEKAIWKAAGLDYETVRNSGSWYVESGLGMGPTLNLAGQKQAYTLSDIGTFLAYESETGLISIVNQGSILLNVYSAIPVNPDKVNVTNSEMAIKMAEWLISPAIQEIIGEYGVKDYGRSLFTPCAGNEQTS